MGRAIIKTSSLAPGAPTSVIAPAKTFPDQEAFLVAFTRGDLVGDFVAVLPGQGPAANGMPELHKLTPALTSLQNQGARVALITDGRMSGASGKFPAAIHITPEAVRGGLIGRIQDGDLIEIDWQKNCIEVHVPAAELAVRPEFQLPSQS